MQAHAPARAARARQVTMATTAATIGAWSFWAPLGLEKAPRATDRRLLITYYADYAPLGLEQAPRATEDHVAQREAPERQDEERAVGGGEGVGDGGGEGGQQRPAGEGLVEPVHAGVHGDQAQDDLRAAKAKEGVGGARYSSRSRAAAQRPRAMDGAVVVVVVVVKGQA